MLLLRLEKTNWGGAGWGGHGSSMIDSAGLICILAGIFQGLTRIRGSASRKASQCNSDSFLQTCQRTLYFKDPTVGLRGSQDSAVASLSTALCWRKKHRSVLTGARVPSWQGDMRVVARGESGHPVTHSCRSVFLHSQFFCMSNRWKVGDGCHNSPEEGYTTWIWVTFGFARAEMRQIYHAKAWSR